MTLNLNNYDYYRRSTPLMVETSQLNSKIKLASTDLPAHRVISSLIFLKNFDTVLIIKKEIQSREHNFKSELKTYVKRPRSSPSAAKSSYYLVDDMLTLNPL